LPVFRVRAAIDMRAAVTLALPAFRLVACGLLATPDKDRGFE
jgi:hypothetical protein